MALLKGKFVSKDEAIQSNNDPTAAEDLSRKSYVDSQAASAASAAVDAKVIVGPMEIAFGSPDGTTLDRSEFLTYDASVGFLLNVGGQMATRSLAQDAVDPQSVIVNDKVEVFGDDGTGPAYSRVRRDYVEAKKVESARELSASLGYDGTESWVGVSETTNTGNNISMAKIFPNKAQLFTVDIAAGTGPQPILPTVDHDLVVKKYVDDGLAGKADLVGGKVPAEQLPSYVDDVIEVADYASLPATGEADKIYIIIDTNKVYRWSGSTYIEIVASPGSTDAVPEGSTNLYFTNERAKAAAVTNEIVDGVIDVAPSQEAVHTALAGKQASLGTGTTSQYLRGDLTWAAISKAAKVLTVGVDANTIAGCIALCTSPTATNNYVIEIPPGTYTENLTIPGNVHLKGLANPSDSLCVKIVGQHTITGASINALNNRVSIANILFTNSHATTATFAISGSADTEVQMSGCYMESTSTASTAKNVSLGLFGKLYANNVKSRMAGSGNGGTHFTIAAGGQLYTQYGLDVDGGTCVIDMTGQGYAQIVYAILACQGASAIKIAANGQVLMQASSVTNNASIGNGINLLGANANCFATHCVFNIQDNAASYVVTGVAGSFFGMFANSYSHIPGVVTRNTKIGANVTQLRYSGSLVASDIGDFQSAVRTAAVADSISDGVTNVAPSQNAVYDALALKAASVHTHTASSITDFTSAAKSAVVDDAIVDGVTDKAPSQNAVYDALAGKANSSHTHIAADITDFNTAAQSALSTQLAGKQDSLGTGTTSQYLRGDLTWAEVPAALTPKKEVFVLTSTDLSNAYLDCAHVAAADSMLLMTGGIPHQEGASEDYTLSTVGGVTRISINSGLLAKLSVGDRVYVMYQK